jgi:hypothetical protein
VEIYKSERQKNIYAHHMSHFLPRVRPQPFLGETVNEVERISLAQQQNSMNILDQVPNLSSPFQKGNIKIYK